MKQLEMGLKLEELLHKAECAVLGIGDETTAEYGILPQNAEVQKSLEKK